MTTDLRTALAEYLNFGVGSALDYAVTRSCSCSSSTTSTNSAARRSALMTGWRGRSCRHRPARAGWECGCPWCSFAAYLHTLDAAVPVVPSGLLSGRGRRAVPYLYSDDDLAALLREAATLKTAGLRW